ncbi:MAG TPA: phage major capsid protein [Acidimicrobiales bacterium]|nr:phage major capsid protein [Acidimicrobiales bacterium]
MTTIEQRRARLRELMRTFEALKAKAIDGTQTEADRRQMGENRAERHEIGRLLADSFNESTRMNRPRARSGSNTRSPARASAPAPAPVATTLRSRDDRMALASSRGIFDGGTERLPYGTCRDLALRDLESRNLPPTAADRLDGLVRNRTSGADGKLISRWLLVTGRDLYRNAWAKVLLGRAAEMTRDEAGAADEFRRLSLDVERAAHADVARQLTERSARGGDLGGLTRAMSEGGSGSLGLPYYLDPSLIVTAGGVAHSQLLDYAANVVVTTNNYHAFTAPSTGFATLAEGVAGNDETPTYSGPDIPIWTARNFLPFSIEWGEDVANLVDNVTEELSNAYQDYVSVKTATGSGTDDIWGVFSRMSATTSSPAHVTVTTLGQIAAKDLRAVFTALPERNRTDPTCAWLLSPTTLDQVAALAAPSVTDGLGPQDFTTDSSTGQRRLFGKPVLEVDAAPAFVSTSGSANYAVVGSFRRYMVATRLGGFSAELVPNLPNIPTSNRPTGSRAFLAVARVGGDVVDPGAFRILANS